MMTFSPRLAQRASACVIALLIACAPVRAAGFSRPDMEKHPGLFLWTDTCNVWVLRDGDEALLISLGDASVLDHLKEIGVKRVEWLLLTDHHRETLQGAKRLDLKATRIAAPKKEQALLETPTQ